MLTGSQLDELLCLCEKGQVPLCAELLAYQARDIFEVWQQLELQNAHSVSPPFWAAVWPGAALTARLLLDEPERVRGQRVWDLGCGGGVAAIAAAVAGASNVTANDIDAVALAVCLANAKANQVMVQTKLGDMLNCLPELGHGDLIIAAEMFYERAPSVSLLHSLQAVVARGGQVLIADGGRAFAPVSRNPPLRAARLSVPPLVEGVTWRDVKVFALDAE